MANDLPESISGFGLSDLRETVYENLDVGAGDQLPPAIRFRVGVIRLLRRRRARKDAASDPTDYAVFLLGKPPEGTELVPFLDDGTAMLVGRIWYVNESVQSAHMLAAPVLHAQGLVTHVIETLKSGDLPTVVFNPNADPAETRYYLDGLGQSTEAECCPLEGDLAEEVKVSEVVAQIHRLALVNPAVQQTPFKVWEDPQRWRPISAAEETIGGMLAIALQVRFQSHTVRRELNVVEGGRLDIEIVWSDYINRTRRVDAVLELKVLRSYWNSGGSVSRDVTLKHVENGVDQAYDYKTKEMSLSGALYCFDMRKDEDCNNCFDHVEKKAAALGVVIRSWRLLNRTAAARAANVARRLNRRKHN